MKQQKPEKIRRPPLKLYEHPNVNELLNRLGLGTTAISAGWGYRPTGIAAKKDSENGKGPLLLFEDAFVRSLIPGTGQVYGLVADSKGIYYDKKGYSDLIDSLSGDKLVGWMRDAPDANQVKIPDLMRRFKESKVSKYNWYPGDYQDIQRPSKMGVMVVDQTKGDTSITFGGVKKVDFDRMVRDALDEHPDKPVYLRSHPDHEYRGKNSCFSPWVFEEQRVHILPSQLSPAECFAFCEEVYAATSLMGMEAMLHGCKVKAYGWNFYAGWGLAEDRCINPKAERNKEISLERLFEASYVQYSHYLDPDTLEPCGLDRILNHLVLQKEIAKYNAATHITVGWNKTKQATADSFFHTPAAELIHTVSCDSGLEKTGSGQNRKYLLWGDQNVPDGLGSSAVRVENGPLELLNFHPQNQKVTSWAFDEMGLYTDSRNASRLECILETGGFTREERDQAEHLEKLLAGIFKGNSSSAAAAWKKQFTQGKKIILIETQAPGRDRVEQIRKEEPEAYIIYKSPAAEGDHQVLADSVDYIVKKKDQIDWLDVCDEFHTDRSNTGFEALLRGIPVKTNALPFYAGWGLTKDTLPCPRRTRSLSITELICGALIKYPLYHNQISGEFTTATKALELMLSGKETDEPEPWYLTPVRLFRKLTRIR